MHGLPPPPPPWHGQFSENLQWGTCLRTTPRSKASTPRFPTDLGTPHTADGPEQVDRASFPRLFSIFPCTEIPESPRPSPGQHRPCNTSDGEQPFFENKWHTFWDFSWKLAFQNFSLNLAHSWSDVVSVLASRTRLRLFQNHQSLNQPPAQPLPQPPDVKTGRHISPTASKNRPPDVQPGRHISKPASPTSLHILQKTSPHQPPNLPPTSPCLSLTPTSPPSPPHNTP